MILKRRVSLHGVHLDSLDDRIIITGIDEAAGKDNISAVSAAGGFGQRITSQRRDTLDVTVKFALNCKSRTRTMMQERAELLEVINAWAAPGGVLTVSHRPGRRLNVVLAQAPGGGDYYNWSSEYTLVFRAYSVPYWSDVTAVSVQGSKAAATGSMSFTLPGSADSVADVTVVNKSGKDIASVAVTIGGKTITFAGTAVLPANGTLTVDHVWNNKIFYLRARVGGSSVLQYRSGADDFVCSPGDVAVSWKADRAVAVTVSARGRYL